MRSSARPLGVASAISLALISATASAAPVELKRYELDVSGSVQRVLAEDLDGDGQRELLVFSVAGDAELERRVSVFAVGADGVGAQPQTSWILDPEGGVFDIGHDREGPSLWYCTSSAVRRYRLREALRRAPVAETWLQESSLLGGRSDEWVLFHDFVQDWHGTGAETPAVIQPGQALVTRGAALPADVVELRTEIEFTEPPASHELLASLPRFVTHRIPALVRVDANGDGRADLVATLGDRVEVHEAGEDGSFARRASQVVRLPSAADPRDESRRQVVQLADLTGDGRVDALLSSLTGGIVNLRQEIGVFPGAGAGFATTPSDKLIMEGAASLALLADLDGDQRPELTTVSLRIGVSAVVSFLLTRRVSVEYATRQLNAEGRIRSQPLLEWSRRVAVEFAGPTDPGVTTLSGDFDGDGVRDLVTAADDDTVEIRKIVRKEGGLAFAETLAQFDAPASGQALAADINADGLSDLAVYAPRRSQGKVTVLLSSPDRPSLRPASSVPRLPGE